MFPLAYPLLLGAGLGALSNRKDPLKGALLGGGMGALGGAVAPAVGGLLGGGVPGVSAGGISEAGALGFNAAKDSQLANLAIGPEAFGGYGSSVSVANPSAGGLLGQFKDAATTLKPMGDAASAAGGLFGGEDQPMQAPGLSPKNASGAQTLAQIAQAGEQQVQEQLMQEAQMRRQRRQGLLGGAYG